MLEGYSVRQLSEQSGHGTDRLRRIVRGWLAKAPPAPQERLDRSHHLIFDGTFVHRPTSLVALMDASSGRLIYAQYPVSENSEKQLRSFFAPLLVRGLNPMSCTVDGNPHAIRVLRALSPGIIIQRCLVHIQRQGLMWCRRNPRTPMARRLRDIFVKVTHIRTGPERDQFVAEVIEWETSYGRQIQRRPERGRVFSDIKRARSMLLRALPDMFHYLDEDPAIPRSTNRLEGYFSTLKAHYRQHRGLRSATLPSYFAWYFFFNPK